MSPAGFDAWQVVIRCALAVAIGGLIGIDRVRHGRAAGMRTHIIVCLGAALTSMTSVYVAQVLGIDGDVFRVSAQVISGIGFLGAGMIILKNNSMLIGLTTAAGVWATGCIGVALGYGFYFGAVVVTLLLLLAINIFSRFEKKHKSTQVIYVELDDMYTANSFMESLKPLIKAEYICQAVTPKSGKNGNIGINVVIEKHIDMTESDFAGLPHVVYAIEEKV